MLKVKWRNRILRKTTFKIGHFLYVFISLYPLICTHRMSEHSFFRLKIVFFSFYPFCTLNPLYTNFEFIFSFSFMFCCYFVSQYKLRSFLTYFIYLLTTFIRFDFFSLELHHNVAHLAIWLWWQYNSHH